MRTDMAKVVVERPRWAHSARNADVRRMRGLVRRADADELPSRAGMAPRHGTLKQFSDFLAPLRRFLRSRLGRRWDAVYAEIRARITPASTVQIHVMEHLWHFVSRHVDVRDGHVFERDGFELFRTGRTFYVHPSTGLLCEPSHRRPSRRAPASPDRLDRGGGLLYLRLAGQWYAVETLPARDGARDAVLCTTVDASNANDREALYGRRGRYAASKRQLDRKRLRDAGLR